MAIKLYHPDNGIVFLSCDIEIKKWLENGAIYYQEGTRPWIKQELPVEVPEIEEVKEVQEVPETPTFPRRGRPRLNGNN